MPKSALLFVFVVNLLLTCSAKARLPDTEAVNAAYYEAVGTIYGEEEEECASDSDAVGKAFFAFLLVAEPLVADRLELVNEVKDAMAGALHECDGPTEFKTTSVLIFLSQVVERYPEEDEIQKLAIDYEANRSSFPWKNLQPKLVARGDFWAFEQGLKRLDWDLQPQAATEAFSDSLGDFLSRASLEEFEKLLREADKLGFKEVVASAVKRIKEDPQWQELRAKLELPQGLLEYEVRALAAQYDLDTLEAPKLEPLTVKGPGYSNESFAKLKSAVEKTPLTKRNDPRFWEKIKTFDELIAAYPQYMAIYQYKANALSWADYKLEALLLQTKVLRMNPNSAESSYYAAQARHWMALGYRGQALVEAHRALNRSVSVYDKDTLLIFCEVAVAESLKEDGLVPESWDAAITDRLEKMEERYGYLVASSNPLCVDAIRFWDKRGDFPRARAALARFKKHGGSAVVAANEGSFADWEKRWDEAGALAIFYGLPEAPKPQGTDLELAFHEGDLPRAWSLYSKWSEAEPRSVEARLFGAAAFADLGAPYLALALIDEGERLSPTVEEAQLLARVRAICSARLEEPLAAAIAYAQSGDVESLSTYWLQVFVEANQAEVYSRISNRALEILSSERPDPDLVAWAWKTYMMTAPKAAVESMRAALVAGSGVPGEPTDLPGKAEEGQSHLQLARSDSQVVSGEVSNRDWLLFAKLAAADGREADAAFFAACWLLALSPDSDYDVSEEDEARSLVAAYRDGKATEGDFSEALLRDPCSVDAMVGAYEADRERGDMFAAAEYLRQIFLAYGDDRIDLLAACNVATAAADWELLLSVSQRTVAKLRSDESRSWYALALIACGKRDTAATIQNQMYDDAFRAVTREIGGWSSFANSRSSYVRELTYGEYADLHGALKDAISLREARKSAAKEPAGNSYYKKQAAELEVAVQKRLEGATPSIRSHVAFQLDEIDEARYQSGQSTPDDRVVARIFSILKRWNVDRTQTLEGEELVEVQSIMFDPNQHLRFRVMAYEMLRNAKVMSDPRPLRASDPIYIEGSVVGAMAQLRAGRLMQVNGADGLLRFLGGTSHLSFPGNRTVRDISMPTAPPFLRLCIAPDLGERRLSGLKANAFESQMMAFGKDTLKPVLFRALTTLKSDLAAAGSGIDARWAALKKGGFRVWRLGEAFYLEDGAFADEVMAVVRPHLGRYPQDAYVATYGSRLFPLKDMGAYVKQLPVKLQTAVELGREAASKSITRHEAAGGSIFDADFDSDKAAQEMLLKYPPGSADFALISEAIGEGRLPNDIEAYLTRVKRGPGGSSSSGVYSPENVKKFEEAVARGDMNAMGEAAYILRGDYYVKWVMRLGDARLDQLMQAKYYSTNASEIKILNDRITKLNNESWRPQIIRSTQSYTRSSSSGTSWSSFSSQMSAKRDAAYEHQRSRDAKNFVIRYRSDGSYSTH